MNIAIRTITTTIAPIASDVSGMNANGYSDLLGTLEIVFAGGSVDVFACGGSFATVWSVPVAFTWRSKTPIIGSFGMPNLMAHAVEFTV